MRAAAVLSLILALPLALGGPAQAQDGGLLPDHADVAYGPHARNVFDLWLPEGPSPPGARPVVVHFHGGGFVGGDKSRFDPQPLLAMGYAVASSNYRFVDGREVLTPVPMQDCARAVQYLRHQAETFGIDPRRVALTGGSAGAVISMWIAYSDDMADPDSEDPVLRQSTRVSCILPRSGPTNLDPLWIREHLGGPDRAHPSMAAFYGSDDFGRPDIRLRIQEASAVHLATADDPPTFLVYRGGLDDLPLPEDASHGLRIHHPYFGQVLKEKLDELGVENRLHYGGGMPTAREIEAFLARHLARHLGRPEGSASPVAAVRATIAAYEAAANARDVAAFREILALEEPERFGNGQSYLSPGP